ncbi:hypothetical protein [Gordonia sp. NPDC003422]
MTLGALLQDLPAVRAAFLAGDLSESRASLVAHAVCGVDAEQRAAAEEAASCWPPMRRRMRCCRTNSTN